MTDKERAYAVAYRATHKDAAKATAKAYYAKHADKLKARAKVYCKAWYAANRDKVKEYGASYRSNHKASARAANKKWRLENADRKKAMDLTWRVAHPNCRKLEYARNSEALKANSRKRYAENPDPWKANSKAWRDANIARARANTKAWQQLNPAKVTAFKRAWALAHPKKHTEVESRRRAIKRRTKVEPVDFKRVLMEANGICAICTKPFDLWGVHFDHKIPLSKGGTHTFDNIQATHARCNLVKGAKVAS